MATVDKGTTISDLFYITELDMLLVISSNPYLVDLRNGNYFNAVRIAERSRLTITVRFLKIWFLDFFKNFNFEFLKDVAYFQRSCWGNAYSVLLVTDGTFIYPMELSTDIFNREAQFQHHSELSKALNRDLSESSQAKIENLLVDPFKVSFNLVD